MDKYINKEETIERINRLFTKNHDGSVAKNDYNSGLYAAKSEIVFITAADVQPVKRGKWLYSNNYSFIVCSQCGHEAYWDTDYGQQLFDYCPYCGARMIKDGDTE